MSWWSLRLLRDALIAVVSAALICYSGNLLGLGVFIAIDAVGLSINFIGSYAVDLPILSSIVLFFVGKFLDRSSKPVTRVCGDILLLLAAMLLGSWLGIEMQRFTVQHGAEDLGIYDGPCEAGVVALGVLFQRSAHSALNRSGSIMIVLGSFLLFRFAAISIEYSHLASHLILTAGEKSLLKLVKVTLSLLVPTATAVLLIRRSARVS